MGVKFEVRGIVRIKMGWKHYQTVDHPKGEFQGRVVQSLIKLTQG